MDAHEDSYWLLSQWHLSSTRRLDKKYHLKRSWLFTMFTLMEENRRIRITSTKSFCELSFPLSHSFHWTTILNFPSCWVLLSFGFVYLFVFGIRLWDLCHRHSASCGHLPHTAAKYSAYHFHATNPLIISPSSFQSLLGRWCTCLGFLTLICLHLLV